VVDRGLAAAVLVQCCAQVVGWFGSWLVLGEDRWLGPALGPVNVGASCSVTCIGRVGFDSGSLRL
jgi:hypothetical protein